MIGAWCMWEKTDHGKGRITLREPFLIVGEGLASWFVIYPNREFDLNPAGYPSVYQAKKSDVRTQAYRWL